MAELKVSDLVAKATAFGSGDLHYISEDQGGSVYISKSVTHSQFITNLNADLDTVYSANGTIGTGRVSTITDTWEISGGETTFKGANALSTEFTALFQDNSGSDILSVRNDGEVGVGGLPLNGVRFTVLGVGTGTNQGIRYQNSAGTPRYIAKDNGNHLWNTSTELFSSKFHFAGKMLISDDSSTGRITHQGEANRVFTDYIEGTGTKLRMGVALANGQLHSGTVADDAVIENSDGVTGFNLFLGTSRTRTDIKINPSGEVGVGISPSEKLHVDGKIRLDNSTAGAAGASSGTYLVLNVGGTDYKLDLLNV